MSNLILPVKIAPITPELLERFKASGEFVKYQIGDDIYKLAWNSGLSGWVVQHPGRAISIAWHIKDEHLTHYLPDGLPDPSAAVEVFETQIERFYLSGNNDYELGIGYPSEVIPPEGTKVGVFKL